VTKAEDSHFLNLFMHINMSFYGQALRYFSVIWTSYLYRDSSQHNNVNCIETTAINFSQLNQYISHTSEITEHSQYLHCRWVYSKY